jgi:hypothetical protein
MSKDKVDHKAEALSYGFQQIPNVITTSSRFTASEKLILAKVFDLMWMNKESKEYKNSCFPTDEYLAFWCDVSERTVGNCKKNPLVQKMFRFIRRWDESDIWLFQGLPDELIKEYKQKVADWEARKPEGLEEIAKKLEDQATNGTLPDGVIRLGKNGKVMGKKFHEDGKTFQDDGRKVQTNYTKLSIPSESDEKNTKRIYASSVSTSEADVESTGSEGKENPDDPSMILSCSPANAGERLGKSVSLPDLPLNYEEKKILFFDDDLDYEALGFPKALELDDEGNRGEENGYPLLAFDDDDDERDRDDERDIWAAYPFEIDSLIPDYQKAHTKVFGLPYRLRRGGVESTYNGILGGKFDPYMSYRLDSKDVPFVRENMEGIMTYAATPVPDPYRWKCKDYSPSVIFNEGVVNRYRELLTLEALPPFSIHRGLTKRTPRRTRRQERIWQWLIAHKNLPIWKFLRKGGAA